MEAPDFFVEDLLDLPNGDEMMSDAYFDSSAAANSTDSSTVTPVDSCNSADANLTSDFHSRPFPDAHFSGELCVPYDDVAQLEWLSNFVEESFSSEDLHKHHLIGAAAGAVPVQVHRHSQFRPEPESTLLRPDGSVPGRARSKLSRVAPSDWSTRLLMVNSTSTDMAPPKKAVKKRAEAAADELEVRRCMHCAAEKTPQWRTGPMGPKTLCNACGVRYKSGRLVPEYRPAASPTFMSTKHSNSHRKVLELRRQNDVVQRHPLHHHHQFLGHHGAASSGGFVGGGNGGDDYLIHHHVGPDFRQLI